MYEYGLVGNCQASALIDQQGSINWLCLPRPDSPPVFGKMIDPQGGAFAIEAVTPGRGTQAYIPNTNVLTTTVECADGSQFKITDFCPRFQQDGDFFRPAALFRMIEPVAGNPMIRILCRPVNGWEKTQVKATREHKGLSFQMGDQKLHLTSNLSPEVIGEETAFALKEKIYLNLSWGAPLADDSMEMSQQFLDKTVDYWKVWVKHCSIPSLFQKETIRSALALKLHVYEDTGAILAALTTSLPEEVGHTRNWDYRFCWLRDSYYILSAFHNLGHFEEMKGFLKFLIEVAEKHEHSRERLRPVYRLDHSLPLPEFEHANWAGFGNSKPVRSNNQAAEHIQNDVYGEMVLTLAPVFFDERFYHLRTKEYKNLLKHLVRFCVKNVSQPDAGLWEIRNGWREHSFSNLMCWAGIERMSRIQDLGIITDFDLDLRKAEEMARKSVMAAAVNGTIRNGPTDDTLDASLLQLPILRFPDKEICHRTVHQIARELSLGTEPEAKNFLYRYIRKDDFGRPASSFVICSFWLAQALGKMGEVEEAKEVMRGTMAAANSLGLISEHYLPFQKIQSGNFPQAYSHVGQINAAFAISPPWHEII